MNNYQFYNLISREKFNSLTTEEKECFLLEKKIFVDSGDYTEAQEKDSIENYGTDFYARHHMNVSLKLEVIDEYLKDTSTYWNIDILIKKISFDLKNAFDYDTKMEILKKYYHYYLDKIKNDPLIEWYFYNSNEDFYKSSFIELSIVNEEDIPFYMKFVHGEHIYFHSNSIFKDWGTLIKHDKILKEIKEVLISPPKKKSIKTESEDNKHKQSTPLNENIFRNYEAQTWFHNTLIEMGAINEDNKAQKGVFQTRCQAIFSISECKNKIFKSQLKLKDYIDYLNAVYSAKITNNSRLSDGYKYKVDVKGYLNLFKDK